RLPGGAAGRVALRIAHRRVHLLHAAVADVHLGALAVGDAIQPGAELVALGGGVDLVEERAEQIANAALRDVGAVLRPVGFHHARLGHLELHQEAVLLPEILDHRPELLRRIVDDQPALGAGALDAQLVELRQHRGRPRIALVAPLRLVAREGRAAPAGLGNDVAVVARRRGEIGRHFERRQRDGRLVVDLAGQRFFGDAASEKQRRRRGGPTAPHQPRPSTIRRPVSAMPASCSASRSGWWQRSETGTIGRRRPYSIRPISAIAHFTGLGLVSMNRRWCSGSTRLLSSRAFFTSPTSAAAHIWCISFGATLAVTEMTPCPPHRISGSAVASSPLYTAKLRGARRSRSVPRSRLAVASLMPMMPGTSASRSTVSFCMSATVRTGTL